MGKDGGSIFVVYDRDESVGEMYLDHIRSQKGANELTSGRRESNSRLLVGNESFYH